MRLRERLRYRSPYANKRPPGGEAPILTFSHFGEGWIEPWDGMGELPPCHEPGLLYRRELLVWPDADGARSIALHIGAWLDNAWGLRDQRALARVGAHIGQFDVSRFR